MNYYEILGIDTNASDEEIKIAYKKLCQKFHPDRETGNEEKYKEVQKAYSILKDRDAKEKYDASGYDEELAKDFERALSAAKNIFKRELNSTVGSDEDDIFSNTLSGIGVKIIRMGNEVVWDSENENKFNNNLINKCNDFVLQSLQSSKQEIKDINKKIKKLRKHKGKYRKIKNPDSITFMERIIDENISALDLKLNNLNDEMKIMKLTIKIFNDYEFIEGQEASGLLNRA